MKKLSTAILAEIVETKRKAAKMTQAQLAEKTGITVSYTHLYLQWDNKHKQDLYIREGCCKCQNDRHADIIRTEIIGNKTVKRC